MAAPELREEPLPRQVPGEVEPNALGLALGPCRELAEAMNMDLAALLAVALQARKHAWVAAGPEAPALRALLRRHSAAALRDADGVAERIHALGGVPAASPATLDAQAPVPPEPEGVFTTRIMLQHDLRGREQLVRGLRRHVLLAHELGDPGTAEVLRAALARQEALAAELARVLADDSLAVGVVRARFGLRDVAGPASAAEDAEGAEAQR